MVAAKPSDVLARTLGFVSWSGDPALYTAGAAAANQEVQAKAIYLPFGVPIGNIELLVSTAGTSTAPTGFFVGIGNATKMLAQSGNLNSSTNLTTLGIGKYALSASYTPNPTDSETGLFYVVFLQNGAFAGTNVQFKRSGGIVALPAGFAIYAGRAGTAQTVLQANGNAYSSALAAAGGQDWWVGVSP